jgi:hypothetical protein
MVRKFATGELSFTEGVDRLVGYILGAIKAPRISGNANPISPSVDWKYFQSR